MASRPLIGLSASVALISDWDCLPETISQTRISEQYSQTLFKVGAIPLVLPARCQNRKPRSVKAVESLAKKVLAKLDGLCLSGGADVLLCEENDSPYLVRAADRDRDFWEAALFLEALRGHKPVLGICRGLQLMNLVFKGTLWRDIPTECSGALNHQQVTARSLVSHKVILEPDSLLCKIAGQKEIMVNSGHHQAVREPGDGFRVSGRSSDGLVEALEHPNYGFVLGVQWHPEGLAEKDKISRELFKALVRAA